MKRTIAFAIIFTLVISGMAHARTYKIANGGWIPWSAANVADVKGFWEEEGLDVIVVTASNPQENVEFLINGVVDITFEMLGTAVGLYMDGVPVQIIAETDWSHGGDKIIVKKELDTNALQDKPIGVYFNFPPVTYFLNQYLSSAGLKLSDTRIIEMEPDTLADHFIAGQFGIIVCFDPQALRAEREGGGKVVATTATYAGSMPEGMLSLEDTVQNIPQDDLAKILKGWVKAVAWSQDPANWPDYMQILNDHTFENDDAYSEEDLRGMLSAVRVHDAATLLERNRDDGGLYAYLQDLKAFLTANDMLTKDFVPEELFDNTAITNALGSIQP